MRYFVDVSRYFINHLMQPHDHLPHDGCVTLNEPQPCPVFTAPALSSSYELGHDIKEFDTPASQSDYESGDTLSVRGFSKSSP